MCLWLSWSHQGKGSGHMWVLTLIFNLRIFSSSEFWGWGLFGKTFHVLNSFMFRCYKQGNLTDNISLLFSEPVFKKFPHTKRIPEEALPFALTSPLMTSLDVEVGERGLSAAGRTPEERSPSLWEVTAEMHLQMKHILRLNPCAKFTRNRIPWRKLSTCLAAETRGQKAAACHASAHPKNYFALQSRRNHASDTAYGRAFAMARDNPDTFWGDVGHDIKWFQPWRKTLDVDDPVFPSW